MKFKLLNTHKKKYYFEINSVRLPASEYPECSNRNSKGLLSLKERSSAKLGGKALLGVPLLNSRAN